MPQGTRLQSGGTSLGAFSLVPSYNMGRTKNALSLDWHEDIRYPEQRLWIAVIVAAFTEYEELLQHIEKMAAEGPVPLFFLTLAQRLRYEIRHEWFAHICEHAGIEHADAVNRTKKLDKQYRLAEIEFTEAVDRTAWRKVNAVKRKMSFNA